MLWVLIRIASLHLHKNMLCVLIRIASICFGYSLEYPPYLSGESVKIKNVTQFQESVAESKVP